MLRPQPQHLELFSQHGQRVMGHARHRLPGAFRFRQSFPGHLDDELIAARSLLDSRDAPDAVLALVFQPLENLEEPAGDRLLANSVKLHPRHMDVVQFACGQVLHRIHVLFVVNGNTPRSGPSVRELAVLAPLGHSSHQNVIAYRETRQHLAATAACSVVTTIGIDALQHPCQELLLGVHQRNHQLLQPVFVDCGLH